MKHSVPPDRRDQTRKDMPVNPLLCNAETDWSVTTCRSRHNVSLRTWSWRVRQLAEISRVAREPSVRNAFLGVGSRGPRSDRAPSDVHRTCSVHRLPWIGDMTSPSSTRSIRALPIRSQQAARLEERAATWVSQAGCSYPGQPQEQQRQVYARL